MLIKFVRKELLIDLYLRRTYVNHFRKILEHEWIQKIVYVFTTLTHTKPSYE